MIDVRKSTVILINFVDYVIEFNAILPKKMAGNGVIYGPFMAILKNP